MAGGATRVAYEEQERIVAAAVSAATEVWGYLDPSRLTASWVRDQIGPRLFLTTARAQELAAMAADVAVDLVLLDEGFDVDPEGHFVPSALAGVASDGRPLDSLLLQPLITTNVALSGGLTTAEAMARGLSSLTRIVGTQVQDAGRAATSVGVAARPGVSYVRLVNPGACSRCAILAGRVYRWSQGFLRHPLCGCRNVPTGDTDRTRLDDPMAVFNALPEAEQNRQFTKAGAQSIRDGADISRVVNARRGALGLSTAGGKSVYTTSEAARTGGPRLMPESIYQLASDRDDAVRLLRRHGYLY